MPEKIPPLEVGRRDGPQRSRSPAVDTAELGYIPGSGDVLVARSSRPDRSSGGESSAYEYCGPLRFRWAEPDQMRSDVLVLEVAGDIDMATAPDLRKAVLKSLATENIGLTVLVIDLVKVTFMGSNALALFVETTQLCSRQGMELRLIANSRVARRPIEACGLTSELNLFADRGSALSI